MENWTLVQGANWSTPLAPNQTKTFTVRPNTGLPTGAYEPVITITGSGGVSAQVRPLFTVALSEITLTPSNPTAIVGVGTGVSGRVPITVTAPPNERVTIVSSNVISGFDPWLFDAAAGTRIADDEAGSLNWSYTIPAGQTMTVYAGMGSFGGASFACYTVTATWSDASLPAVEASTTGLANLTVGQEVSDASVVYTLNNGTYATSITPASFTVSGLPTGLTAGTAQRTSDTVVTMPITGTPITQITNASLLNRAASIPASNVTGATSEILIMGTITAGPIASAPSSVQITPKPLTTTVGQTTQLTATVLPANAADKSVTWTSSNTGVATVSVLGSVTAVGAGQATITARTSNGLTDTCVVTVEAAPVYSLSLAQNGSTDPYVFPSLPGGYTNPGSITLTLTNTGNRSISSLHVALSGANSGSFSVVPGANFTSIEPGATRTLTVSPKNGLTQGSYSADIAVQGNLATSNSFKVSFSVSSDYVPVQSITTVSRIEYYGSIILYTGATTIIDAYITPENATNKKVNWSSSDTRVVTVDENGKVTAVGSGWAQIKATTEDGGKTSSKPFEVRESPYSIALDTTAVAFAEVDPGYRAPTARTIRVTNDGTYNTGALTVSLSGNNAASFTLSRTSIPSIALRGSATFTVVPRTGLAAGTHTATVTVRVANGISESFTVSFTVR